MTEERIGGIAVSVGGSWAELETALAAAEKRLDAFTKKYSNVNTNLGAASGNASSSRTAASSGGSSSTRQTDITAFTRAVGEATTRLTALAAALNSVTTAARSSSRQPAQSGGAGVAAALTAITSNPTQAVRAKLAVDRMMPKGSSRGGALDVTEAPGARLPNVRSSRIPNDPAVAANRAEFATRQRMFINDIASAERRTSASRPASPSEKALLDALYPAPAKPMTATERLRQRRAQAANDLTASYAASYAAQPIPPQSLGSREVFQGPPMSQAMIDAQAKAAREEQERLRADEPRGQSGPRGFTMNGSPFYDLGGPKTEPHERAALAAKQKAADAEALRNRGRGYLLPDERLARAALSRGGVGSRYRPKNDEDIERETENRIAIRESQTVAATRTGRTGANVMGGFFLGGGRQRIADENALTEATQKYRSAQKSVVEIENVLDDPHLSPKNRAQATQDLTAAQNELNAAAEREVAARKKVASYSGLAAGARNLLGATIGGAAFGLGLEAVGVATKAAERAAAPYFDAMTGWAQKTADLTNGLADQARQAQGNAKGVTALYIAQTGLADSTAATVSPIIAQRAQIEAGNKAIVDQVQTLRDAQNLSRQGANAGIVGGGTGGILGTGIFGTASTGEQIGNYLQSINDNFPSAFTQASGMSANQFAGLAQGGQVGTIQSNVASAQANAPTAAQQMRAEVQKGVEYVNAQLVKGGDAAAKFTQALDKTDPRIEATAKQFDGIQPEMAKAVRELSIYSTGITDAQSAISAFKAINLAGTQIGPSDAVAATNIAIQNAINSATAPAPGQQSAIEIQQAHQMPSFLGQQTRTAQYAMGTQQPFQAYLANLAAPPTKIGSSVSAVGAAEQQRLNAGIKEAQSLQQPLNTLYAEGNAAVKATYDPGILQMFGQAGVQTFNTMLGQIGQVGQKMADIQSSINMEQAQYAAAQYTNEIRIASRSLTDIKQLTGQIGQTSGDNLGIYERQNLLLGRQSQQLQFMLAQRQINLQVAVAGFQVPGLTPAEQAARVAEAKLEASYSQKQLDYQKQMFGNQVKIVDIGNLRQAVDLTKQIGLLQQGRAVTIDVALKQETLTRLAKIQSALTAQVQSYVGAVDNLQGKYISNIAAEEAAAGKAIKTLGDTMSTAVYSVWHAAFLGITGQALGGGGSSAPSGGVGTSAKRPVSGSNSSPTKNAAGFLGTTSGATSMIVGEAGTETVAVLRNPRSVAMGAGGGDSHFTIPVSVYLDGERIYQSTLRRMGRDAAARGLRGPN